LNNLYIIIIHCNRLILQPFNIATMRACDNCGKNGLDKFCVSKCYQRLHKIRKPKRRLADTIACTKCEDLATTGIYESGDCTLHVCAKCLPDYDRREECSWASAEFMTKDEAHRWVDVCISEDAFTKEQGVRICAKIDKLFLRALE
jgi:hypothetical protein